MNRIKLSVVFVFFTVAAIFYFLPSSIVRGENSAALNAPSGLTASDNAYSTKIGLIWNPVRGASAYRILRNTANSSASAADLGTTVASNFFDASAIAGQTYFYWIRAENGSTLSDLSVADQGTRASGTQTGNIAPLAPPTAPAENPLTAAKAALGKVLFWDEQLSSTRTVACGTCHFASSGGIDKRTNQQRTRSKNPGFDNLLNTADDVFGSPGVMSNNSDGTFNYSANYGFREQVTARRTMPYTDAAFSNSLFWDGRATATFRDPLTNAVVVQNGAALESQVLGPPTSDTEMAHSGRNWTDVAARVAQSKPLALASSVPSGLQSWIDNRTYPELFAEAFGSSEVTPIRIALAIATHERTLFSDQTPFDQVNQGIGALSAAEQRGRNLFNSPQSDCNVCHTGNLLSDNQFHYLGVRPTNEETGRFQVTNNQANVGQFRTPNLRNVELRNAYFHNGNFTTLNEVVGFYSRGGDFTAPNKDPNVRPRNFNAGQIADLTAFLSRPLTDPRVRDELPPFDRPHLYTESTRVPIVSGTGRTGSGNFVPLVNAIEPPLAGNPNFTVGVSNALGNTSAILVIDTQDPGAGTTIPAAGALTRIQINLQNTGAGSGSGSVSIPIPDDAFYVGKTFYGRWYVVDAGAANGFEVSQVFQFTVFGEGTTANRPQFGDFDGDGTAEFSVYRPSDGNWYFLNSLANNFAAVNFGSSGDQIVPADYDGDGKNDVAVFRQGNWIIRRSSDSQTVTVSFGLSDDIPVPADFDGDGKADVTVFRPSNGAWYRLNSSNNFFVANSWGTFGDKPAIGDFDGDGRADLCVYRPSNGVWYRLNSSNNQFVAAGFGAAEDLIVPADYDGDGKTDIAVFRPSTSNWYRINSFDGSFAALNWGISTDKPVPADYDHDGKTDVAVYRDGFWYIVKSSNSQIAYGNFGTIGDVPIPNAFVK